MADDLTQADENEPNADANVGLLAVLAGLSICVYGIIATLSWQFDFDSVTTDRPIILVLCLFAVVFAFYLGAIRIAWRTRQGGQMMKLVIGSAIVFRIVMLFSLPIQEVDIYRYLWDGAVSTAGVSPFRYSPEQVSSADLASGADEDLVRLVKMRDDNPALAEILNRVHFPELPTIYPPTSQAVFAAANLTTPSSSSVLTRMFIMKAWFIGFDIATLFVVIGLLGRCAKPVGLCVIYAWCPLLMKEVANSGHLDAVAVFATTLAVYLVVRSLGFQPGNKDTQARSLGYATLTGLTLALAVGAKLYPVILVPVFLLALARKVGRRLMPIPIAVFSVVVAILLWPMIEGKNNVADDQVSSDPSLGVVTFLRRWEMNDFLFLLVVENLKPNAQRGTHEIAWFTIVPDSTREAVVRSASSSLKVPPAESPFLVTRVMTAIAFVMVAILLAWRASPADNRQVVEAAFLTIAWFWLLCPTLNPWYWTWALPLLPFARGRVWLVMSGLAFLYYLRFWLSYHFENAAVLGTPYTGAAFYDFVVTWIEFAPWFIALIAGVVFRLQKSSWFDMPHFNSEDTLQTF
ncbi:putative membrane protein [Rhodopirellula maiorica SM1]|uniref:Putative membrane protein n=1 Tax=Rhodopirellula maiorica SM1 TaxID=1265738 RepID=M5RMU8_9BACT|nr:membrane protein [Rhodopirellula maiorica]EMI20653.1 putative membrane protein [Rhodopirellula maiorica SM1]